ncbi:MAG: DUF2442 domain-containing protein [Pseudomonadales bacterium]|nr:DUF2442 domain-containing protein [Pseudomonadales bacterium]
MSSSADELKQPVATGVTIRNEKLIVELSDGREIVVPISWYPRLENGTPEERERWQLIGKGHGIYWEDLDEDISVAALLAGEASAESSESLQRWLSSRDA